MQANRSDLRGTDSEGQPYIIPICGDDDLSRLGRANDLVLIRWVREISGLGIDRSARIVKALRLRDFDLSDHAIGAVIAGIGLEASTDHIHGIREGLQCGAADVGQRGSFGSVAI